MTHSVWKEDSCGDWGTEDGGASISTTGMGKASLESVATADVIEGNTEWKKPAAVEERIDKQQRTKNTQGFDEGEKRPDKEQWTSVIAHNVGTGSPDITHKVSGEKRHAKQTYELREGRPQRNVEEPHERKGSEPLLCDSEAKTKAAQHREEEGRERLQQEATEEHLSSDVQGSEEMQKQTGVLNAALNLSGDIYAAEKTEDSAALAFEGECSAAGAMHALGMEGTRIAAEGIECNSSRRSNSVRTTRSSREEKAGDDDLTEVLERLFSWENLLRDRQLASSIKPGEWVVDIDALLVHPAVAARGGCSREQLQASIHRSSVLSLTESPSLSSCSISSCNRDHNVTAQAAHCCVEEYATLREDGGVGEGDSKTGSREAVAEDHKKETYKSNHISKNNEITMDSSNSKGNNATTLDSRSSSSSKSAEDLGDGRKSRRSGCSGNSEIGKLFGQREIEVLRQQGREGTDTNNQEDPTAGFFPCGGGGAAAVEENVVEIAIDRQPLTIPENDAQPLGDGSTSEAAINANTSKSTKAFSNGKEEREILHEDKHNQEQKQQQHNGEDVHSDDDLPISASSRTTADTAAAAVSAPSLPSEKTKGRLCVSLKALFGDTRSTIVLRDVPAVVTVADILQLLLQAPYAQKALQQQQKHEREEHEVELEGRKQLHQEHQHEEGTGGSHERSDQAESPQESQQRTVTGGLDSLEIKEDLSGCKRPKPSGVELQQPHREERRTVFSCSQYRVPSRGDASFSSERCCTAFAAEIKKSGGAGIVKAVRAESNGTWFVTLRDAHAAQEVALWLRMQNLGGRPVRAGIKATHYLQHVVSSLHDPSARSPAAVVAAGMVQPQHQMTRGRCDVAGPHIGCDIRTAEHLLQGRSNNGAMKGQQQQQQQGLSSLHQEEQRQLQQVPIESPENGEGGCSWPPTTIAQQQHQLQGLSRLSHHTHHEQTRWAALALVRGGHMRMRGSIHGRRATGLAHGHCGSNCRGVRGSTRPSPTHFYQTPPPPPEGCSVLWCPLSGSSSSSVSVAVNSGTVYTQNTIRCCGSPLCSRNNGTYDGRTLPGHEGFYPVYGPLPEMGVYYHPQASLYCFSTPPRACYGSASLAEEQGSLPGTTGGDPINGQGTHSVAAPRTRYEHSGGGAISPYACGAYRAAAAAAAALADADIATATGSLLGKDFVPPQPPSCGLSHPTSFRTPVGGLRYYQQWEETSRASSSCSSSGNSDSSNSSSSRPSEPTRDNYQAPAQSPCPFPTGGSILSGTTPVPEANEGGKTAKEATVEVISTAADAGMSPSEAEEKLQPHPLSERKLPTAGDKVQGTKGRGGISATVQEEHRDDVVVAARAATGTTVGDTAVPHEAENEKAGKEEELEKGDKKNVEGNVKVKTVVDTKEEDISNRTATVGETLALHDESASIKAGNPERSAAEEQQEESTAGKPVARRWSSFSSSLSNSRESSRVPPQQRRTIPPNGMVIASFPPRGTKEAISIAEETVQEIEASRTLCASVTPAEEEGLSLPETEEPVTSPSRRQVADETHNTTRAADAFTASSGAALASPRGALDCSQSVVSLSNGEDAGRRSSSIWRSLKEGAMSFVEGEDAQATQSARAGFIMSERNDGAGTERVTEVELSKEETANATTTDKAVEGAEVRDRQQAKGIRVSPEDSCPSSRGCTASMPHVGHCVNKSNSKGNRSSRLMAQRSGENGGTASTGETEKSRGWVAERGASAMKKASAGEKNLPESLAAVEEEKLPKEQQLKQSEHINNGTKTELIGIELKGSAAFAARCNGITAVRLRRQRHGVAGSTAAAVVKPGDAGEQRGEGGAAKTPSKEEKDEMVTGRTPEYCTAEEGDEVADAKRPSGDPEQINRNMLREHGTVAALEHEAEASRNVDEVTTARSMERAAEDCFQLRGDISRDTLDSAMGDRRSNSVRDGEIATFAETAADDAAGLQQQQKPFMYPFPSLYGYSGPLLQQQQHDSCYSPTLTPETPPSAGNNEGDADAHSSAEADTLAVDFFGDSGTSGVVSDPAFAAEYYCAYYWHQYYMAAAAAATAESGDLAAAAAAVGKAYMVAVAATNAAAAACNRAALIDSHIDQRASFSTAAQPRPLGERSGREWGGEGGSQQHSYAVGGGRSYETQQRVQELRPQQSPVVAASVGGETSGTAHTKAQESSGAGAVTGEEGNKVNAGTLGGKGQRGAEAAANGDGEGTEGVATEAYSSETAGAAAPAKHVGVTAAALERGVDTVIEPQQLQRQEERSFAALAGTTGIVESEGGDGARALAGRHTCNATSCTWRTGYRGPTGAGGLNSNTPRGCGRGAMSLAAGGRRNRECVGVGGRRPLDRQCYGPPDYWCTSVSSSSYPGWLCPLYFYPRPPPPPELQALLQNGRRMGCYQWENEMYGAGGRSVHLGNWGGSIAERLYMQPTWVAAAARDADESLYVEQRRRTQQQRQQRYEEAEQQKPGFDEEVTEKKEDGTNSEEANEASESTTTLEEPEQNWGKAAEAGGDDHQEGEDESLCPSTPSVVAGVGAGAPTQKTAETEISEGTSAPGSGNGAATSTDVGSSVTGSSPGHPASPRRSIQALWDPLLGGGRYIGNRDYESVGDEMWPHAGDCSWGEGEPPVAAADYCPAAGEEERHAQIRRNNRDYRGDVGDPQHRQHDLPPPTYVCNYYQQRFIHPLYHWQMHQSSFQPQQQCCTERQQQQPRHFRRRPFYQPQQRYRQPCPPPSQHQQQFPTRHQPHSQPRYYQSRHASMHQPFYYYYYQLQQYHRNLMPGAVPRNSFPRGAKGGGGVGGSNRAASRIWRNSHTSGNPGGTNGGLGNRDAVRPHRRSRSSAAGAVSTTASVRVALSGSVGGHSSHAGDNYVTAGAEREEKGPSRCACTAEHASLDDGGGTPSVGREGREATKGLAASGAAGKIGIPRRSRDRGTLGSHNGTGTATSQQQQRSKPGKQGEGRGNDAPRGASNQQSESTSAAARSGASAATEAVQPRIPNTRTPGCRSSSTREGDTSKRRNFQPPSQGRRRHPFPESTHATQAPCPKLEGPDFPSLSVSVAAARHPKKAGTSLNIAGTLRCAEIVEKEGLLKSEVAEASGETATQENVADNQKVENMETNNKDGGARGATRTDAAARWADFALRQQQQNPQGNSNTVSKGGDSPTGSLSISGAAHPAEDDAVSKVSFSPTVEKSEQEMTHTVEYSQAKERPQEVQEKEEGNERNQRQWGHQLYSPSQRRWQRGSPYARHYRQASMHGQRHRHHLPSHGITHRQHLVHMYPGSPAARKQLRERENAWEAEEEDSKHGERKRSFSQIRRQRHCFHGPLHSGETMRDIGVMNTERSNTWPSGTTMKANTHNNCKKSFNGRTRVAADYHACAAAK